MLRILLAILLIGLAPFGSAMACTQPGGAKGLKSGMIGWINQERAANGLNRLAPSGQLAAAAQGHACDMADRGYFSHQRVGGPDLSARVKAEGYRFRTAAENIAKTRATQVSSVVAIWQQSAAHWDNILNSKVTEIGLGIATGGDGRTYWVMNIGRSR